MYLYIIGSKRKEQTVMFRSIIETTKEATYVINAVAFFVILIIATYICVMWLLFVLSDTIKTVKSKIKYPSTIHTNFSLHFFQLTSLFFSCLYPPHPPPSSYTATFTPDHNKFFPNLLETAVDQLNDTDTDLLNLFAVEADILQNITTTEHFERFINNDAEFESLVSGGGEEEKSGFKCAECGRVCKTKKLLKNHLLTHSGVKGFVCKVCAKSFKRNYELTAHMRSHNRPTFQCEMCSKMFLHRSHLSCHRKKHLKEYAAFCKECSKGFVAQGDYKNHVKVYHKNILHMCDICGARLTTSSALKEHKLTHSPSYGKERPHICEICGKTYLTLRNLRNHIKTHEQPLRFVCRVCGKKLSGKKVLETHVKMHTGEKNHICEFCHKAFASEEYLVVHKRTHTGEKPFRCEVCGKCFTQKTSLTVHLRYHSGQKPYKCECGKGFVTKTHLMTHYKIHEINGIDFSCISEHKIGWNKVFVETISVVYFQL